MIHTCIHWQGYSSNNSKINSAVKLKVKIEFTNSLRQLTIYPGMWENRSKTNKRWNSFNIAVLIHFLFTQTKQQYMVWVAFSNSLSVALWDVHKLVQGLGGCRWTMIGLSMFKTVPQVSISPSLCGRLMLWSRAHWATCLVHGWPGCSSGYLNPSHIPSTPPLSHPPHYMRKSWSF